jgi:hypothetical protein
MRRKLKIAGLATSVGLMALLAACAAAMRFGSVGDHTLRPVSASAMPPTSGRHAPVWQHCGFYDAPVPVERAVHSLEHGVVWITYRPDLAAEHIEILRGLTGDDEYVIVSPYPAQSSPVVATAWGHQTRFEHAEQAALQQFIQRFRNGPDAPEPGAGCDGPNLFFTGGAGRPRHP